MTEPTIYPLTLEALWQATEGLKERLRFHIDPLDLATLYAAGFAGSPA